MYTLDDVSGLLCEFLGLGCNNTPAFTLARLLLYTRGEGYIIDEADAI